MSLEFEIPLVSLIFILILNIVYFSKKRADLEENKPYKVILISSLIVATIDTVIHIICSANTFESIVNNYYTLLNYLNKILSALFSVIFSSLFFYTLLITYDKVRKNPKKISTILIIANIVFSVIMLFTNIELVDAKVATNVTGATTMLGYAMVAIMLTCSLLVALTNIKKLDKRYLPIFIVFLLLVILYFFSLLIPGMIIYDLILALMCYIMYFTIENPDMKMLDEVHKAKVISDNANEEKTLFLYNMTNEIRGITKDIDRETDNILDETDNKKIDIEEINNSARNIKGSTAKFTTMTNEILDISSIDSASVRIYNEKYNIKRLLKELVGIYKPKAQNKNLDFRVSIASDIPEYLYGDGINLKKVLTIILDNSIKYTNNGYIEFNINTIIKGDIARLIISVEDSGIGMKAEDINKIFTKKQEREDNHNLNNNLYNAKRLITLMNGTIVPSSSYGSGTTIKIILDQKYDTIDTDINKYDNIYDKKKVLLIDDSPSSEKLFNKILSGTNIELTSVKLGKEGLEKIRSKEKYDLILLDEELEPQNGHIIMRKLLEIRNFNIKVILLTKDNKYDYDDSYLQEGFTDYIIKSSDKEEILNKMNKYLS
jgi:signal transduction histidine kinase/CheY-like chemotaxis protein